jgi:N-sulfoglucosamine sulfohydrolase
MIYKKFTTVFLSIMGLAGLSFGITDPESQENSDRPNILWITCKDISPYLGSYGFEQAHTPNLDKLAQISIRYTNAYANAPVCAVARATLLSGMYASSTGTHQMRSRVQLPGEIPAYPKILRQEGYYCTNNSKKDYNSNYENDQSLWDESSNKAHYKNRKEGQPFFAVFNNTVTHESQLSKDRIQHYVDNKLIPNNPRIHPKDINLPPYHPDLPEIREDWARLHDLITLMDKMTGDLLQELKDEGLEENTIVFFYSDHGGQLSRSKRFIYNVGTQVPLMVHLPEKWKHLANKNQGDIDASLISFVDLAPTVLSITGTKIPEKMQGRVFLDPKMVKSMDHVHFYRDRMSERYDFSRAVTDGHYYFIRNFFPHRPLGRDTRYGNSVQANWRAWEEYHAQGKTDAIQSQFFQPKPALELFDSEYDPWHIASITNQPEFGGKLNSLSNELDRWMIETRDIGLIPEPMFHDLAGENKTYKTIYDYAQSGDYPIDSILDAAKAASSSDPEKIASYFKYIKHDHPVIRFWGAYGFFLTRSRHEGVVQTLKKMIIEDEFAANRLMAAQALGLCGDPRHAFESIMKEVNATSQGYVFLQGINAFQYSHTDDLLSMNDWIRFKNKKFSDGDVATDFGFNQRIIDDAIGLFPERRIVD